MQLREKLKESNILKDELIKRINLLELNLKVQEHDFIKKTEE